jgi:hypothetical protein
MKKPWWSHGKAHSLGHYVEQKTNKGYVSHFHLAIYIKTVSKGKRRIMKTQIYFTMQKTKKKT